MSWLPKNERRKYARIPCEINLKIKDPSCNIIKTAKSVDISNKGIQISLCEPIKLHEHIEIIPDIFYIANSKQNNIYKAEVRWIRSDNSSKNTKYLAGLKILDNINWHIPLSKIEKSLNKSNSQIYSHILSLIDDRLILLNSKLEPIWINKNHDWNFLNTYNTQSSPIDILFNLKIHSKKLKDLISDIVIYKKFHTLLIPSFNIVASNKNDICIPFDLLITPFLSCKETVKYILIRININNKLNMSENMTWIDYRYLHIGRLLEDMLEEIVNPISAAMGRLELLCLKLDNKIDEITYNDLLSIKNNIKIISKICRSTLKDKNSNLLNNFNIFSLSYLIKTEIENIKIHKSFKNIDIKLKLDHNITKIHGNYELWSLAIKTLCKNLQKKMKYSQDKQIIIETFNTFNKIFIRITHTGKQLKKNIFNEPGLSIFQILAKEYPLKIHIDGPSGNQTILIELSLIVSIDNTNPYYSRKLFTL